MCEVLIEQTVQFRSFFKKIGIFPPSMIKKSGWASVFFSGSFSCSLRLRSDCTQCNWKNLTHFWQCDTFFQMNFNKEIAALNVHSETANPIQFLTVWRRFFRGSNVKMRKIFWGLLISCTWIQCEYCYNLKQISTVSLYSAVISWTIL